MLEAKGREALRRADRVRKQAWHEAEYESTRYGCQPGRQALIEARREDVHAMRVRLRRACDHELRAVLQIRSEKARAEAAAAE